MTHTADVRWNSIMNTTKQVVRCDEKYLRKQLYFLITTQIILGIIIYIWLQTIIVFAGVAVFAVASYLDYIIRKRWKFTIGPDHLRTEKIFTHHIDLRTPLDQVVGISVYEGILEALNGVGTIEISTSSSRPDHALITWCHLRDARNIALRLETLLKDKRRIEPGG